MDKAKGSRKATPPPTLSKKKTTFFKIGSVLFSLLLIVLLEVILRVSGFGTDYPLFIEANDQPEYLVMNPEISKKYFSNTKDATSGYQELFKKKKDAQTFRIFVLGASTGIGYPYRYNGPFHRWLQYSLGVTYPDKNFEIINLSLTAINTYTLLDFTKEMVSYEPNAVLIYAGHNEYYGALGVGSINSIGKSPWLVNLSLSLRKYRLVQLFSNSLAGLKSWGNSEKSNPETLMKKMVGDQQIPYKSKLYDEGIYQFKSNLEDMLSLLHKKSIPTFISTLVSNEKDLPPFISDSTNQNKSASYQYQLGKQKYAASEFSAAKEKFLLAKEYDLLRFRAPTSMNKIIKEITNTYPNIYLVDTYEKFGKANQDGIIGHETLLEHVHPNLKGYSLLAHSFYTSLINQNMFKETASEKILSWNDLWQRMPITKIDSLQGALEIATLKKGWPFYQPMPKIDRENLSVPEKLTGQMAIQQLSWEQAMDKLYQYSVQQKDYETAFKVVEGITLQYPNEPQYFIKAAALALQYDKTKEAGYLYRRAFTLKPSIDLAKKIAVNLVDKELLKESLPYLEFLRKKEPEGTYGTRLYNSIQTILELKNKDTAVESDSNKMIQLAENYLLLGKRDNAISYLQQVLKLEPSNSKARELMERIK